MRDRTPLSTSENYSRQFHPDQLDLDQFAVAIRLLLTPRRPGLLSTGDQVIHVVPGSSGSKPN